MGFFGKTQLFGVGVVQECIVDVNQFVDLLPFLEPEGGPAFNDIEKLEKSPLNSILVRVTTKKQVETVNLAYPMFPSHFLMPIKPGELVWLIDIGDQLYWLCRKPASSKIEDVSWTIGSRANDPPAPRPTGDDADQSASDENVLPDAPPPSDPYWADSAMEELKEGQEKFFEWLAARGTVGSNLPEPVPRFRKRPGDFVIQGSNNTLISLGSDRGYSLKQPHVALGEEAAEVYGAFDGNDTGTSATSSNVPGSGTIDIVTGRGRYPPLTPTSASALGEEPTRTAASVIENVFMADSPHLGLEIDKAPEVNQVQDSHLNPMEGDPDFWADCSRIYISSKTSPDLAFNLVDPDLKPELCMYPLVPAAVTAGDVGTVPEPVVETPAIVIKSDEIRIISRYMAPEDGKENPYLEETAAAKQIINGSIAIIKEGVRDDKGHSAQDGNGAAGIFLRPDGVVMIDGASIVIGTGRESDEPGEGNQIYLGAGAVEPVVLGIQLDAFFNIVIDAMKTWISATYDTHTHPTGVGPSGIPLVLKSDPIGSITSDYNMYKSKVAMTK